MIQVLGACSPMRRPRRVLRRSTPAGVVRTLIAHLACSLALCGAIGFMLVGCGQDDGGPPDRVRVQAYVLDGTPTGSWRSVRAAVQWPGADPRATCELYQPGMALTMPTIPFDTSFTTSLRFYDSTECTGPALAIGRSTPQTVPRAGSEERLVYVPIGPVAQFVPTSRVVPDPETGGVSTQPSQPSTPRYGASVTPLPDGRVVVIGGARLASPTGGALTDNHLADVRPWDDLDNIAEVFDTVEIWDSSTGAWEALDTNPASPQTLFYARCFHEAVYLPASRLIAVIGGYQKLPGSPVQPSRFIELFDPATRQFYAADSVGPLGVARVGHSAEVMTYRQGADTQEYLHVAGGRDQAASSYEVLTMEPEGANNAHLRVFDTFPNGRWGHQVAMITGSDDRRRLLFVGGENAQGPSPFIDIYEVDDPTPRFVEVPGSPAPAGMAEPRVGHRVVYVPAGTGLLQEGLYVLGGFTNAARTEITRRIEVFNTGNANMPIGQSMVGAEANFNLNTNRAFHGAAILNTGHILITGGINHDAGSGRKRMVQGNEVVAVVPTATGSEIRANATSGFITNRFHHALVALPSGAGLAVGGIVTGTDEVRNVGALGTDRSAEVIVYE